MSSRQRAVLVVTSASGFMVFLDATVVNVAFPSIASSFPTASRADLSWVLSAYSIVFAAMLIPGGRLGDMLGRRRAFVIGLTLFVLASALCAAAPSVELLVGARVLQGLGGALVVPTSQALLMAAFPPERRGAAVGLWSAAAAVAAALGPPLGGLLVEASSWRLVFLVNLPGGLLALLAARVLDASPAARRSASLDLPGGALVIAAIGSLALAIVQGGQWGWANPPILAAFAAAVLFGAALAWRCLKRPGSVIDPRLLRLRQFSFASAGTLLLGIGLFAFLLGGVLFLTGVWRYDILRAGLAMTPTPLVGAVTAIIAGRLVDRIDPRLVAIPGAALLGAGALWIDAHAGTAPDFLGAWLPGAALTGAGVGFGYATLTTVAVLGLPTEMFGVGSGVSAMTRQLGTVLGVSLLVAVLGTPGPDDVIASFGRGWVLVALASLAGLVMAAMLGPARRKRSEAIVVRPAEGRA